MKLAIAQMVFGVLIVVDWITLSLGIAWGCKPIWLEHDLLEGVLRVIAILPMTLFLVVGLAVLGCGIAQYLKARG